MSTLFQTTLQNLNQVQQATQAIPPPPILPPYKQTFFQPNNQNLTPNPPLFSSFVNQHAPPPLMQQGAYNAHNLLINSDKLAQVQEFYNENIDDYDDYNDDEDDEINILEEKNKKKTGETIQTAFSTNEKKNFETNLTEQSSKRQNIGQKNEQFELIAQKNKFESLNKKNESSSKTNDLKKVSTAEDTTKIIQNKELKNIETNLNANNQNFKTGPLSSKTNFIFNTSSNLEQSARTTLFNLESTKTSKPEKKEDKQSNNEKVSSKCLSFDAKSSNAATSLSASQLEHDEEMNENPEDYEPDIEFKPLVKLEQVELKTGEEDEEVILKQRCKLYKFDITSKEWKEKGIGDMKILKHKTKNTYRLLMRRDQVLKVCLNQKIVPEIKFEIQSDKYIQWIANDFSEGKTVQETLLAKFKNESDALKFLSEINVVKGLNDKSKNKEIEHSSRLGLQQKSILQESNFSKPNHIDNSLQQGPLRTNINSTSLSDQNTALYIAGSNSIETTKNGDYENPKNNLTNIKSLSNKAPTSTVLPNDTVSSGFNSKTTNKNLEGQNNNQNKIVDKSIFSSSTFGSPSSGFQTGVFNFGFPKATDEKEKTKSEESKNKFNFESLSTKAPVSTVIPTDNALGGIKSKNSNENFAAQNNNQNIIEDKNKNIFSAPIPAGGFNFGLPKVADEKEKIKNQDNKSIFNFESLYTKAPVSTVIPAPSEINSKKTNENIVSQNNNQNIIEDKNKNILSSFGAPNQTGGFNFVIPKAANEKEKTKFDDSKNIFSFGTLSTKVPASAVLQNNTVSSGLNSKTTNQNIASQNSNQNIIEDSNKSIFGSNTFVSPSSGFQIGGLNFGLPKAADEKEETKNQDNKSIFNFESSSTKAPVSTVIPASSEINSKKTNENIALQNNNQNTTENKNKSIFSSNTFGAPIQAGGFSFGFPKAADEKEETKSEEIKNKFNFETLSTKVPASTVLPNNTVSSGINSKTTNENIASQNNNQNIIEDKKKSIFGSNTFDSPSSGIQTGLFNFGFPKVPNEEEKTKSEESKNKFNFESSFTKAPVSTGIPTDTASGGIKSKNTNENFATQNNNQNITEDTNKNIFSSNAFASGFNFGLLKAADEKEKINNQENKSKLNFETLSTKASASSGKSGTNNNFNSAQFFDVKVDQTVEVKGKNDSNDSIENIRNSGVSLPQSSQKTSFGKNSFATNSANAQQKPFTFTPSKLNFIGDQLCQSFDLQNSENSNKKNSLMSFNISENKNLSSDSVEASHFDTCQSNVNFSFTPLSQETKKLLHESDKKKSCVVASELPTFSSKPNLKPTINVCSDTSPITSDLKWKCSKCQNINEEKIKECITCKLQDSNDANIKKDDKKIGSSNEFFGNTTTQTMFQFGSNFINIADAIKKSEKKLSDDQINSNSNLDEPKFNIFSNFIAQPNLADKALINEHLNLNNNLFSNAKSSNAATSLSASQLEHEEEMNENPEDYEPDIEFKPLVKLEQVELKTGEEDEEVILKQRCKLYKFDITSKEWKEKGIGDMKILKHKTKNTYRLLMRRDQVLKVCLNQKIVPEIKFEIQSDKYIQWIANDFSEGKTVQETLLAKFKNESDALKFLSELNKIKSFDEKSNHTEIHDENKVGLKDSKPLSELFKTESKWTCETCLVLNDKSQNICSCCNSQKDGTSPSITSEGIQLKVEDKSKYIFGNISNNLLTNGASNFQFTFGSMPKLDENTTVKSESTNKVSNEPTSVFSFSSNNFLVPFGSSNTEYSIINSTNDQQKVFQQNLNSTNSTVAPKAVNSFSSIGSNTLTASSSSIYSTPVTSSSTSLQKMEDENKENNAFIQNNNFNEVSNISVKIEENTQNQRISKYETESYSSDVLVSAAYPEIFENTIDIQPLKVNKVEYYDFVKKQSELNTSVAGNFSGANSNESDGMVYN